MFYHFLHSVPSVKFVLVPIDTKEIRNGVFSFPTEILREATELLREVQKVKGRSRLSDAY